MCIPGREIRLPILEDMLQKLGVEVIGTKDRQGTSFERIEAKVGEWPKHLHVYVSENLFYIGRPELSFMVTLHSLT